MDIFKFLLLHSKLNPNDLAIKAANSNISFLDLFDLTVKVGNKLKSLGIKEKDTVLIRSATDPALDWTLTLAASYIGAVTCSQFDYQEISAILPSDWIITNKEISNNDVPSNVILVDKAWLTSTNQKSSECHPYEWHKDAIARLFLTSGTTGTAKVVPYSMSNILSRAKSYIGRWSKYGHEMNLMDLASYGGFTVALSNLIRGTPFYAGATLAEKYTLITSSPIGFLSGSPAHFFELIGRLEKDNKQLTNLNAIRYGGGPVTKKLLARMQAFLCKSIYNSYASTETGDIFISQYHHTTHNLPIAGTVLPEATVKIIDSNGNRLGVNQVGLLAVRSDYMAHEYLNNPAMTEAMFKNGWFYPGDCGFKTKDDIFILLGRNSELLNVSGVKINPVVFENQLLEYAAIKDVTVFLTETSLGSEIICFGIACEQSQIDMTHLETFIVEKFKLPKNKFQIIQLSSIPRNPMGKVLKQELRERYSSL